MIEQVTIVVNPYCHQGRGWKRWIAIKERVRQSIPVPVTEVVTEKGWSHSELLLPLLLHPGAGCIISAGGDGSLHTLVNALIKPDHTGSARIPIGAIGLGSSNDFLKPFHSFVGGIPARIDIKKPYRQQDAGKVVYRDAADRPGEKYFIVNASFGATAEGNWNFNHPGALLQWLKRRASGLAISYTAMTTLLRFTSRPALIRFNGEEKGILVSNINVIKKPFVAGSLYYTQAPQPDDGRLGLHICMNMRRWELLHTLFGLEKGRFPQSSKRLSAYTDACSVSAAEPFVFECDGETEKARQVSISVIPKAFTLLGE